MMVIGICGGSGSGKTTLLRRLAQNFSGQKPSVFSMDNYYKSIEKQLIDENGEVNFDLPTALHEEKLVSDLDALISGDSIEVREYHFNSPPDKHVLITLDPSEIIIVEGLFCMHYPGVRERLDYSIFIDVALDVQLDRRLYRDQETRGYTHDAIMYQWNNHVLPCYEQFLLPYKEQADFQFRNDARADQDFELLVREIRERL
ncbi:MAG: uridine kinase [Bacteroidetes bacterium]|nr:MAG: uridine kinase [Bacteroidota bacterium]